MKRIDNRLGVRHQAGFTLIETILTIVIASILSGMVAVFISGPVAGYVAAGQRSDLTDEADLVLRRMAREISLALPNSLRVTDGSGNHGSCSSGNCFVEFIMTSGGGAYHSETDGVSGTPLNYSDSSTTCTATASKCQFSVLGAMPSPAITAGDHIVVYNLGQDADQHSYAPADAYQCGAATVPANCNMAWVAATPATAANSTVSLTSGTGDKSVFSLQSPPLPSPSQRFHVVPGGVGAVTFQCPTAAAGAGDVLRYSGYGIFSTSALAIAALTGPTKLATRATCTIAYTSAATQRNGLLSVTLTLSNAAGESVTLMRQIVMDNSP